MKALKIVVAFVLAFVLLSADFLPAQAQTKPRKSWSKKAKGAAIGGGAGAATGAVVGGGKGAIVGGVVGAAAGGIIGRKKDKKKDTKRYEQYSRKD